MESKVRDTFLAAIGKARRWMDELADGVSIAAIAQREGEERLHPYVCWRPLRSFLLRWLGPW